MNDQEVERLARGMHDAWFREGSPMSKIPDWERKVPAMKDAWLAAARHAIRDLRVETKPTTKEPPVMTWHWPLWKHMADNHGLTLLDSECDDIIECVMAMKDKVEIRRV